MKAALEREQGEQKEGEEEEEEDVGPALPAGLKRAREDNDEDAGPAPPSKPKKQRGIHFISHNFGALSCYNYFCEFILFFIVLEFEDLYVSNLPVGDMYEVSYMHRDVVTHVLVAPIKNFIITAR